MKTISSTQRVQAGSARLLKEAGADARPAGSSSQVSLESATLKNRVEQAFSAPLNEARLTSVDPGTNPNVSMPSRLAPKNRDSTTISRSELENLIAKTHARLTAQDVGVESFDRAISPEQLAMMAKENDPAKVISELMPRNKDVSVEEMERLGIKHGAFNGDRHPLLRSVRLCEVPGVYGAEVRAKSLLTYEQDPSGGPTKTFFSQYPFYLSGKLGRQI